MPGRDAAHRNASYTTLQRPFGSHGVKNETANLTESPRLPAACRARPLSGAPSAQAPSERTRSFQRAWNGAAPPRRQGEAANPVSSQ